MTQSHSKLLTDLHAGRLRKLIWELKLQSHPLIEDLNEDLINPVMEGLSDSGEDLRDAGVDTLTVALGLIMRARVMLSESEPRHKCELFAEALRLEAEHFKESIPLYFTNEVVHEVSPETDVENG